MYSFLEIICTIYYNFSVCKQFEENVLKIRRVWGYTFLVPCDNLRIFFNSIYLFTKFIFVIYTYMYLNLECKNQIKHCFSTYIFYMVNVYIFVNDTCNGRKMCIMSLNLELTECSKLNLKQRNMSNSICIRMKDPLCASLEAECYL